MGDRSLTSVSSSRSVVLWALALAVAAVVGLGTVSGGGGGSPRAERATLQVATFGSLNLYGAGSSRLFPKTEEPEPEPTAPDVAAQHPRLVPVTLHVQYENGVRPRAMLLFHRHAGRKASAICGRNADRSGVFRVNLEPGSHHVRGLFDALSLHQDDPLPLGVPTWTIDTRNTRTWDLTIPVAAQVLVHDPDRGLPELWLDGVRVKLEWEEWSSRHRGGPLYLYTSHSSSTRIALVKPGTYTIYRGTGAQRWSRTVVLNASEPFVLGKDS